MRLTRMTLKLKSIGVANATMPSVWKHDHNILERGAFGNFETVSESRIAVAVEDEDWSATQSRRALLVSCNRKDFLAWTKISFCG